LYEEFEDDYLSDMDSCPQCQIGRVRMVSKPYLKLFQGQLFTVPDALYYRCDACDFQQVDDSIYNIISDMVFAARIHTPADEKSPSVPPAYEDETSHKSDPPRI